MNKKQNKEPETLSLPKPDDPSLKGEFKCFGGSMNDSFNNILMNQAFNTLWTTHSDKDARKQQILAALTAMHAVRPVDEMEGQIAAQMVATHAAAMECYRRAMIGDQSFESRRENLNQAAKLTRLHADLILALDKHRGKGQQRVTVEHVHVHQGGQAIVGNVQAGGGAQSKLEDLPHAPALIHEPGQTLQGKIETVAEAVPVARS
jgi:hypothetical protein